MVMADAWYYARGQERVGPMGLAELAKQLPQLQGERTLVFGPGMANWVEARTVPQLAGAMRPSGGGSGGMGGSPPVPSNRRSDEVDYQIFGEEMQYVEITLDPGEMVIAEAGG